MDDIMYKTLASITIFVVIIGNRGTDASIKCYVCDSRKQSGCSSSSPGESYINECSEHVLNKMKTNTIGGTNLGDIYEKTGLSSIVSAISKIFADYTTCMKLESDGEVIRSCGGADVQCTEKEKVSDGVRVSCCNEDKCNHSTVLKSSSIIVASVVLIFITITKFVL